MTAPIDLTQKLGELWCVTLAPLPVRQALRLMGVGTPTDMPDGLATMTHRLTTGVDDGYAFLLARPAAPQWTLVLELEPTAGWLGHDPGVLADLADDTIACSIMRDPNKILAMFVENGQPPSGLDIITGRRWGTLGNRLAAALTAAGFPGQDDDEPADHLAQLTFSQGAALALHAATGVHLADDALADPWTGGLTPTS